MIRGLGGGGGVCYPTMNEALDWIPAILALGKWKKETQKAKVILSYAASQRPA